VTLQSDVFLQAVAISCDGFSPDDDYFHLARNRGKTVVFTPVKSGAAAFQGSLRGAQLARGDHRSRVRRFRDSPRRSRESGRSRERRSPANRVSVCLDSRLPE